MDEIRKDDSLDKLYPTLETVQEALKGDDRFPKMSIITLHYVLHQLNFRYISKKEARNSMLVERPEIISYRAKFIKTIRRARDLGRQVYYLDESYVNCSHSPTKLWVDKTVQSAADAAACGLSAGPTLPSGAVLA